MSRSTLVPGSGAGDNSPSEPAARIANLHFSYPAPFPDSPPVCALAGIDLDLARGAFVALMGPVGAGKSTLCLALNGAIPHVVEGDLDGGVVLYGRDTRQVSMGQLAAEVGLVLEDVEAQLFNTSVADEVAFGLEAMGLPVPEIEERIRSTLKLVGLSGFEQRVPRTLSGGEQKRLALASVLAMRPRLLILDEPTSGLDPRGRNSVLTAIDRMRRGRGREMTVLMATQDAEAAARFADRVLVLRQGRVALDGTPEQVFAQVSRLDRWGVDVPQLARLSQRIGQEGTQTGGFLHLDQARPALAATIAGRGAPAATTQPLPASAPFERVIEMRGVEFRYPGTEQQAISGIDLEIGQGEWWAIIGVNGSGKSTLIRHLNGLLKPSRGHVRVGGRDTADRRIGELARVVSYLPQNPDHLLFSATVRQEVGYGPRQMGLRGAALDERVAQTLDLLGLGSYPEHPPAVLSYGLRRQVALASVLAMRTQVVALDEPAAGLDRGTAARLLDVIAERHRQGTTVVMITHDLRWVEQYAQRVVVLDQGRLVGRGTPREVLADVDLLSRAGLDPLPVTALAHSLCFAPPLPISVDQWLARTSRV
jgi:energy-coupling factor transport system ATP-binding protein